MAVRASPSHHYVPRFYLASFVERDVPELWTPRVWVHDRASNSVWQEIPKKLCEERGFYRLSDDGPDPEVVEKWLQKTETLAAEALRRVTADRVVGRPIDKEALSLFIAVMDLRTKARREHTERQVGGLMRMTMQLRMNRPDGMDWMRAQLERFGDKNAKQRTNAEVRKIMAESIGRFQVEKGREEHIRGTVEHAEFIASMLMAKNWCVVAAEDGASFVTCDAPVVLCTPLPSPGPQFGIGYETPLVEVWLPLTPEVAVVATRQDVPRTANIPRRLVDSINERTALHTSELAFGHIERPEVMRLWTRGGSDERGTVGS
jgi:hypothetical protein